MRRRIDIPQARALVLSREQVLASGYSERQMRSDLASGRLLRLHRGSYVSAQVWEELWWEGRHLLRVLAVHAASSGPGPVFTHASAASLWGLPLYRVGTAPVQVLVDGRRHSRVIADVIRRDMKVDPADIVEIDGIRVTSLTRTAMDIARTYPFPTAVACADAALRRASVDVYIVDAEADAAWREDVARLAAPGLRGVRQARRALKYREDDVRGVTGWRFARWGHGNIRTPDVLGARLAAFGIRPPG